MHSIPNIPNNRITAVNRNPTEPQRTAAGGILQQLSATASIEFASVLARIPEHLQYGVRILLDTGESLDSKQWWSQLVSFFVDQGLQQLAVETTNIVGVEGLTVRAGIDAALLEHMRDSCPSLETLTVREGDPSNRLTQFLAEDSRFVSLKLALMRDDSLATLSRAIAQNTALRSLWLITESNNTAPLALALRGRSMDGLIVDASPVALIPITKAVCDGDLRVKNLTLVQKHCLDAEYKNFILGLCELVKSSPNVEALRVECKSLLGFVDRMSDAIAHTRLLELHIEAVCISKGFLGPLPEPYIETLLAGLRRNPSLLAFSINGATEDQQEEILKVVRANARMPAAARVAIGHAFAISVGRPYEMPVDAGAEMMRHLTPSEARPLAMLNRATHQASMEGRLLALVSEGDPQGITALCQRWEGMGMGIGLDKAVREHVLSSALKRLDPQVDKVKAASVAHALLRAFVSEGGGAPAYVPSKETLAQLAQLAAAADDEALLALVSDLFQRA